MTKILLVEDDKSLREIYGVRLLAEGYDIVSAGDGEEALAMAIKDRPNLIISDVMMPKISGFDMLDILRSTTETKDIKVIMMTALSSEDQRARGEQLGADRYLVKSQVGIEDVVQTVHDVLQDAPKAAGATSFTSSPSVRQATPVAPAPRPVASTPAPAPSYVAPVSPAPTPTLEPQATPAASTLPQPTAPFSTARPAGFGVGDRVINPLPREERSGPDISTMMEKELGVQPAAPTPTPLASPSTPPAPQPTPSTVQPAPQPAQPAFSLPTPPTIPTPPAPSAQPFSSPADTGLDFEETPRPEATTPSQPAPNGNPFVNPSEPPAAL